MEEMQDKPADNFPVFVPETLIEEIESSYDRAAMDEVKIINKNGRHFLTSKSTSRVIKVNVREMRKVGLKVYGPFFIVYSVVPGSEVDLGPIAFYEFGHSYSYKRTIAGAWYA